MTANTDSPVTASISSSDGTDFSALQFRYPFWKYQQMILDVVEQQARSDHKHHIVAPPGSGKTIVGLELIRHFGQPAVVFAPTTTIQKQWQEKVALFTPDREWLAGNTSLDAGRLAPINLLTYQILSTPGENLAFVERIAMERWADDLCSSGQVATEQEAHQRIHTLQEANPKAFRAEISKRYRRIKREFLRQGDMDGRQFLHANARDLIDRIVRLGTGTLVLDECHHLLDYWAFILRELIKALPDVHVIGLTATLPNLENQSEYENYTLLLGDVDFEVPTPAVVKEGNLAPYRDLVYFCEPSPREYRYLRRIQDHFETAAKRITGTQAFQEWLWRTIVERQSATESHTPTHEPFDAFLDREPLLCIAGVKWLLAQGRALDPDVLIIDEMREPLTIDDWLTLLEVYGLRELKVSPDREHQALFRELRRVLLAFGITITERGVRHQRSPGDLVLSLSEAKDAAAVEILAAEAGAMGERLRAVVITDFERLSAHSRHLKDVLDPDAGSAVRVFRRLVADPDTNALAPILVTGQVVLVSAEKQADLDARLVRWTEESGASLAWEWATTDDPRVLRLAGRGRDWTSRTYVALITGWFEQGLTRCLVGTRGILGEGWDALALNTLIDLTSVTTSTGVRQIRGRSLRLDPRWPRKLAHNWDVVCYSHKFEKGDLDVRRLVTRHAHVWGILIRSKREELAAAIALAMEGMLSPRWEGRVVRGVAHLDPDLALDLAWRDFKRIDFQQYTRRMLAAVDKRDQVYDLWKVGEPYSNFSYSATQLQPEDVKFRTVFTVEQSLKSLAWRLLVSVVSLALAIWFNGIMLASGLPESAAAVVLAMVVGLGALVAIVANLGQAARVFRKAFIEMPADDILLDIGRALLAALRDAGLVSRHLNDNYVRVVETEAGGLEVFLDYASPEDSNTFSQAYQELMGPIGDARYLIERDSTSLRHHVFRPAWLLVRKLLRLGDDVKAYHRVPDVLANRRERAEDLARYWKRYVGGGRLVYTRHAEGRSILLHARGKPRRKIRQMAFEFWK